MFEVPNEMYKYWANEAYDWLDEAYGCVKGTGRYQEAMNKYNEALKLSRMFLTDEYIELNNDYECSLERLRVFRELMGVPRWETEDLNNLRVLYDHCLNIHNDIVKKKTEYENQVLNQ